MVNFLSQYPQWYGFSPVCVLLCTSKFPFSANIFPQSRKSHSNRFYPLWADFLWRSSRDWREKDLRQLSMVHTNLLVFLWLPSWCLRCCFSLNVFPHPSNMHLKTRSGSYRIVKKTWEPTWVLIWVLRLPASVNCLIHVLNGQWSWPLWFLCEDLSIDLCYHFGYDRLKGHILWLSFWQVLLNLWDNISELLHGFVSDLRLTGLVKRNLDKEDGFALGILGNHMITLRCDEPCWQATSETSRYFKWLRNSLLMEQITFFNCI